MLITDSVYLQDFIPPMKLTTPYTFGPRHLITHDLKDEAHWRMNLKIHPINVHCVLHRAQNGSIWIDAPKVCPDQSYLHFQDPNKIWQEIYPIFAVMADLVQAGDETWPHLVLDGIVETLCRRALDLPNYMRNLTFLPPDLFSQAEQMVCLLQC